MSDTFAIIAASLISSGTILVTALAALHNHKRTAARRATLDFISSTQFGSSEWVELNRNFRELRQQDKLASLLVSDGGDPVSATQVCLLLNHFELVAVAIKNKIIDKQLYAEWFRGTYVKIWKDSEGFVAELRRKNANAKLFVGFEQLAKEWSESRSP